METNVKFSKSLINNNNNNNNKNEMKTEISMDVDQAAALLASLKHKLPSKSKQNDNNKRKREDINDKSILIQSPLNKKRKMDTNTNNVNTDLQNILLNALNPTTPSSTTQKQQQHQL